MMAEPRTKREKYVYVEPTGVDTGISPSTLAGKGTKRSDDLSKPTVRYLVQNKKQFRFLGTKFTKRMDKLIQASWNTIYNFYNKAWEVMNKAKRAKELLALRTKGMPKDKSGKVIGKLKSQKEIREETLKRAMARVAVIAKPKPVFLPPPLDRGKKANLQQMQARLAVIAEPRGINIKYVRPSIDPTYVDPLRVSEAARTCVPSARVLELSACPPHWLVKHPVYKPGAVKRSALTCKVSPRFLELAVPKKKAAEKDNDLKENPFDISKNALKYKATPRVLELAKPVERD